MSALLEDLWISVAGYLALEAASSDHRYEYRDGHLRMMSGGTRAHSRIKLNVATAIDPALTPPCTMYDSDARVKLRETRYFYPDMVITCAPQPNDNLVDVVAPTLVMEVLAKSTAAYDRSDKLDVYRACPSLQWILLIEQEKPLVEVFRRRSPDLWNMHQYGLNDTIDFATWGIQLPVAHIYRGITFTSQVL